MTKYGAAVATLHVGRRAAENSLHADRYAREIGRPMNTHVTISFVSLDVAEDDAGRVFQQLQARVARWWKDQRERRGRDIGPILSMHGHANPAGSRHVHWLLHVPAAIASDFAVIVTKRLRKLTGRTELGDALHIAPVEHAGGTAKYILRGIEPMFGGYLHIKPADEGLVRGCRRTGVSRAASKTARRKAGWKRKRPRGRQSGQPRTARRRRRPRAA